MEEMKGLRNKLKALFYSDKQTKAAMQVDEKSGYTMDLRAVGYWAWKILMAENAIIEGVFRNCASWNNSVKLFREGGLDLKLTSERMAVFNGKRSFDSIRNALRSLRGIVEG